MGRLYIVVRRGFEFVRIQEVNADETVLGRSSKCGVWLPDPCVSREHAIIARNESGFLIRDLGSRNGTELNGHRILGQQAIGDRSELQICQFRLKLFFNEIDAYQDTENLEDTTLLRGQALHAVTDDGVDQQLLRLTPAQRRVYDLLFEGLLEKEVAARLGITVHTVHDHAKAIYRILSVSTRAELISRSVNQQKN